MTPPLLPLAQASGLTGAADAVSAPSTPLTSFSPLPSQATADEKRVWAQNLPTAATLFDRLALSSRPDHIERQESIANPHAPETPVNPRTLLKRAAGGSDKAGMQLHANWVGDGRHDNLLMAVPVYGEAMAWAKACFEHDVGAVVSLGTEAEHDRLYPCMENDSPIVVNGQQVQFSPANQKGQLGSDAESLTEKPFNFAIGAAWVDTGRAGNDQPDARHELLNFYVPIPADEAIRPGILLPVCRALHAENLGRPIAFQSPKGDDRGAVFAAAHGLFQEFAKGELNERNLEQRVLQQCIDLRGARSATLFSRPDHLASLLTMGKMMLEDPRGKPEEPLAGMRTPGLLSAENPAARPVRSALKGARALAQGKAGHRAQFRFAESVVDNERPATRIDVRQIFSKPETWSEEEQVQVRKTRGRRSGPQVD